jgi:uncharacterized FlaG/YvyC family protein
MIVPGVDAVVLNQIQNQTKDRVVNESRETTLKTKKERQALDYPHYFNKDEVEESVKQLNKTADLANISLRFQVDDNDGKLFVLVIDREKGEIIRSIPPEKAMKMNDKIKYMIGLMVDELV